MEYKIRLAEDEDFEQIYKIWMDGIASSFVETPRPENLEELFKQNFDNRNGHFNFWVAYEELEILGWVSLLPCTVNPLKKNTVAEISVYVAKEYNNNHLATTIMKKAFTDVKNSSLKFIFGYVLVSNKAIIKAGAENDVIEYGRIPASEKVPKSDEKIILIHKVNS